MRHPLIKLFHLSNLLQMPEDYRMVNIEFFGKFSCSCIEEGNGNPLQCSCLENPRDWGAWWAAIMGSQRVRHDWSDLAAAAACSCKRISFNNTLNWSLSISDWCPLNSSSTRLSFPWENFLNHHCTVCLLAIPGPNMLLMLRVVSTDLHPILTQIRKSLEFAFCLTSYP